MGRSRDREGSLSSTGSGRTARSKKWDGDTGHRVHLSDLSVGVSKHEIEKVFRPYGQINEIWVASNPPCFAFINFRHRADGERAIKELDGTILAGSRIGLSWARVRRYGGRSRHRSPSPSYRRGYRDSYSSGSRRRNSRSRSRSPYYRGSGGGSSRRRSPISHSPSPRDNRREERPKTSKREHKRRRHSSSNSDRSDKRSPRRDNGKKTSRSPSNERQRSATPNGDNRTANRDDNRAE
ncbi:unnamed protein product [Rotaria sp. Silwood2]|nr:unnamed protein product [Rotaria sp. Silwood2]CAF2576557.1 unnamed protein product [Rotaria sp. Silwood2]CAF2823991.1 unnamed protein product [Rotaria sp. Silwood2]CAF2976443.1 unnamed protein product [Rotaria sp. Silwood2]